MNEFQALCERFNTAARAEPKCLYHGISFNGDEVFCREAYDGAEGVLEHVANVATLFTEALGLARVTRLEIHGVEEELSKLREPLSAFNPTYYRLVCGFRR